MLGEAEHLSCPTNHHSMDSLTHIAVGACMGEGFVGKKVSRKAMLWGALAQSIPDIDFLAALWMDTPRSLLAHRGFTHSILFGVLISVFFAITCLNLYIMSIYLSNIYSEIKNRPLYIIESVKRY